MSQIFSRPWYSVLVAALALSAVHARPIQEGEATGIEARSPRLIPDTANYVHEVLQGLGLADPSSSATPTTTVTATATPKQDVQSHTETVHVESNYPDHVEPVSSSSQSSYSKNTGPTPTTHITYTSSSSTSYTPTHDSDDAGYTHTVEHHVSHQPANIELMHGWSKGRKLTADDLPGVFDAVYRELRHQVGDAINSSDELGLNEFLENY